MAIKTVKQFANWISVINSEIEDLKRAPLGRGTCVERTSLQVRHVVA